MSIDPDIAAVLAGESDGCIVCADCLDVLAAMPEGCVEAVVTDPPYELGFMGKSWDRTGIAFKPATWAACLRALKPGGHLIAFGGSRTHHRIWCAIEDAGFEIRDEIQWLYGSGFPKSLDVSKAIDKAAGAEREVVGLRNPCHERSSWHANNSCLGYGGYGPEIAEGRAITAPATDAARQWDGWGTALKPACEPICVARKPLGERTVAANVLKHGTGGLNINGCRVPALHDNGDYDHVRQNDTVHGYKGLAGGKAFARGEPFTVTPPHTLGRWPANVCHDGSDEVLAGFPDLKGIGLTGERGGGVANSGEAVTYSRGWQQKSRWDSLVDNAGGSAARFFYCAKASRAEREAGLEGMPKQQGFDKNTSRQIAHTNPETGKTTYTEYQPSQRRNHHPTVKPLALMRWLVRLVTPPGGIVLDPFLGSGTTAMACKCEGFRCIGIEKDEAHAAIARARIAATSKPLFGPDETGGRAEMPLFGENYA